MAVTEELAARPMLCACFLAFVGCGGVGIDDAEPNSTGEEATDERGGDDDADETETPPAAMLSEVRQRLEHGSDVLVVGRSLLETLGVLPDYDCGDTAVYVSAQVATRLDDVFSCATIQADADGVTTRVAFPPGGCEALGLTFEGELAVVASAGDDRLFVSIDMHDLTVDGQDVSSSGDYDKCGDASRLAVRSSGVLAAGDAYLVDAAITKEPGLPVVGSTTLTMDGTAERTDAEGTDRLTFTELEYEPGAFLPKNGSLTLETADGHLVVATFSERSFLHGEVTIEIDAYPPVTLPLL